nr:MAG TPA: hypothetical protein [Bacteriophage sp.]
MPVSIFQINILYYHIKSYLLTLLEFLSLYNLHKILS